MIDYSQNREQTVILDFFRATPRGTFLDVGANDGATLSNSRALALLGWRGVCVEPAAIAFGKLAQLYEKSDVLAVNAAITEQDGPIDFYDSGTHLNKGDTSLLSTTQAGEMDRWRKSGEKFTKTTVRGITIKTLLKECGREKFDFVTIDAEGLDLAILRQLDLGALGVRMVCVETNGVRNSDYDDYCAFHGLRLHWTCYENRIFVRPDKK